ncbi:hypothetical protein [Methylobacterium sp.]|uniref:hypothetical protein n=1 Tax=Methylobacterium sp. TaxID=409 RepID=UPI0025DDF24C|nr:hypothetical protein [Methylobacterium sp.]MBY0260307.1 hypothetical protein [Methylobacterium sp.]
MEIKFREAVTGTIACDGLSFRECDISGATLDFAGRKPVEFADCVGADTAQWQVRGQPVTYADFAALVRSTLVEREQHEP